MQFVTTVNEPRDFGNKSDLKFIERLDDDWLEIIILKILLDKLIYWIVMTFWNKFDYNNKDLINLQVSKMIWIIHRATIF